MLLSCANTQVESFNRVNILTTITYGLTLTPSLFSLLITERTHYTRNSNIQLNIISRENILCKFHKSKSSYRLRFRKKSFLRKTFLTDVSLSTPYENSTELLSIKIVEQIPSKASTSLIGCVNLNKRFRKF